MLGDVGESVGYTVDAARTRHYQASDAFKQGCLARSIDPHDRGCRTRFKGVAHFVEGIEIVIGDGQVVNTYSQLESVVVADGWIRTCDRAELLAGYQLDRLLGRALRVHALV